MAFLVFAGVIRSKLLAPLTNGFIRDGDTPFSQQLFNLTEADTESMVEPDGVADDFGWETVALVAELFGVYAPQSAKRQLN